MRIAIGVTGSSGAVYAVEFIKACPGDKYLIASKWGKVVLQDEMGVTERDLQPHVKRIFSNDDLHAPLASGSNALDAFVIIPCTTSTLGKIASGIGDSLITRTAQVALKERFRMVLCVRETPLSSLALEQCLRLSRDGVIIMPISPPLYFLPTTVQAYVQAFVDKVLGVLGVRQSRGWRAEELE
ncbi:MAG: UbiX family flavin prenyltransferase [candidate division KSB1 bacterium]|nr:UbiX family flavin prenyltransferase [candidate division KSB1 bacterium]MDZ7275859.1 UbiX family flavin prenyltransferase [candidate division KSB1 bacterium]MDZ7287609.1 UbiX family flavin prenyltransferase [candidate division KSB1 bacterium]MDZ7306487.1 UbiX family flavin prenyltransferase [candidate division KSB1 bacterium]MDZ7350587.1 UbiX family flavin prenyltransferase [candidate division KSB1 bacterium]